MAIKRYGYLGRLQDNLLMEVSNLIKIKNFDKVQDTNQIMHYYYQGEHCFHQGNYDTKKILLLGFLLAKHKDNQH